MQYAVCRNSSRWRMMSWNQKSESGIRNQKSRIRNSELEIVDLSFMLGEAYTVKYTYTSGAEAAGPLELSLFISPASWMYAVASAGFKTVHEMAHVQLNEEHGMSSPADRVSLLVQNYLLDRRRFDKVNIALLNTEFAMIPEAYAGQDLVKPLLQFATGGASLKTLKQHGFSGLKFCYEPDSDLAAQLERLFPNAALRHAGAVSLQLLLSHHSLQAATVFLNIHDGFIELAAKHKNDPMFYNVFNYSTDEDILYYLLFMMEQFHLDPSFIKLAVAAQRSAGDELIRSMGRYIRHVSLCVHDPSVQLSGEPGKLPSHYYFTLLNQHLCVL